MATLAMALIDVFAACGIGRIFLGLEERSEQEADDSHAQGGRHASEEHTHHTSYTVAETQ
jgi:hypothetical protein